MLTSIPELSELLVGAWMAKDPRYESSTVGDLMRRQHLVQALYETRCAPLQRCVGFMVLFHAMANRSPTWRVASAGVLGYDLSRTQSILRVATTACPTGGSEVRERMVALEAWSDERWAALVIQRLVRWRRRAARKRATRRHSSMF